MVAKEWRYYRIMVRSRFVLSGRGDLAVAYHTLPYHGLAVCWHRRVRPSAVREVRLVAANFKNLSCVRSWWVVVHDQSPWYFRWWVVTSLVSTGIGLGGDVRRTWWMAQARLIFNFVSGQARWDKEGLLSHTLSHNKKRDEYLRTREGINYLFLMTVGWRSATQTVGGLLKHARLIFNFGIGQDRCTCRPNCSKWDIMCTLKGCCRIRCLNPKKGRILMKSDALILYNNDLDAPTTTTVLRVSRNCSRKEEKAR